MHHQRPAAIDKESPRVNFFVALLFVALSFILEDVTHNFCLELTLYYESVSRIMIRNLNLNLNYLCILTFPAHVRVPTPELPDTHTCSFILRNATP